MADMVDYVEGFMVLNEQSLHSSSTAFPSQLGFIQQLQSGSSDVYYCIEFAVHYSSVKESNVDHVIYFPSSYIPFHFHGLFKDCLLLPTKIYAPTLTRVIWRHELELPNYPRDQITHLGQSIWFWPFTIFLLFLSPLGFDD